MLKQPALYRKLKTAVAVRKAADGRGSHYAVAWNDQRKGILPAGLAHRSGRRTQLPRKLTVASGPARIDGGDLRPYSPLKFRAPPPTRQIEMKLRIGEVAPDLRARPRGEAIFRRKRLARLRQKLDLGEDIAFRANAENGKRRRQSSLKASVGGTHRFLHLMPGKLDAMLAQRVTRTADPRLSLISCIRRPTRELNGASDTVCALGGRLGATTKRRREDP